MRRPFLRAACPDSGVDKDYFEYTVHSGDIDVGRHMNNVAYVRMMLDRFTTAQLSQFAVSEYEIVYKNPCYEGEKLRICTRDSGAQVLQTVLKANGSVAAAASMTKKAATV